MLLVLGYNFTGDRKGVVQTLMIKIDALWV